MNGCGFYSSALWWTGELFTVHPTNQCQLGLASTSRDPGKDKQLWKMNNEWMNFTFLISLFSSGSVLTCPTQDGRSQPRFLIGDTNKTTEQNISSFHSLFPLKKNSFLKLLFITYGSLEQGHFWQWEFWVIQLIVSAQLVVGSFANASYSIFMPSTSMMFPTNKIMLHHIFVLLAMW